MSESNAIKVGDRVTVEFEGVVYRCWDRAAEVRDDHSAQWIAPLSALTVIPPPTPPEPPVGAVVLDDLGNAWQHEDGDAWATVGCSATCSWEDLNDRCAPLTLLVPQETP